MFAPEQPHALRARSSPTSLLSWCALCVRCGPGAQGSRPWPSLARARAPGCQPAGLCPTAFPRPRPVAACVPGSIPSGCGRAGWPGPRLAAWCAEQGGLVLGQSQTAQQSPALPAMPALLHVCAITGGMGTLDAMGGQRQSAPQIVEPGGDARWALQHNPTQPSTASPPPVPQPSEPKRPWRQAANCFDACDHTHGRRGRRRLWLMTDMVARPGLEQGPGLPPGMAVATLRMAPKPAPVTRDDRCDMARLRRSADTWVRMMRQHGASDHTGHGS
jgi:hypothetical protein